MVHDLAWRKCSSFVEELAGTLHPQNEGKRVHVPPDEKTCGHAGNTVQKGTYRD